MSPIEAMLRAELLSIETASPIVDLTHLRTPSFATDSMLRLWPTFDILAHGETDNVFLFAQARCAGYRADLMLWSHGHSLIIECDGFDFHDRTTQQATYDRARDRELVRAGATVIRFTGSEIHRSVEQCARDIKSTWAALADRHNALVDVLDRTHPANVLPEEHW